MPIAKEGRQCPPLRSITDFKPPADEDPVAGHSDHGHLSALDNLALRIKNEHGGLLPDNGAVSVVSKRMAESGNSEHGTASRLFVDAIGQGHRSGHSLRAPGVGFSSRARTRNALPASAVARFNDPPFTTCPEDRAACGDGFSIADRGNELLRYEHDNFQSVPAARLHKPAVQMRFSSNCLARSLVTIPSRGAINVFGSVLFGSYNRDFGHMEGQNAHWRRLLPRGKVPPVKPDRSWRVWTGAGNVFGISIRIFCTRAAISVSPAPARNPMGQAGNLLASLESDPSRNGTSISLPLTEKLSLVSATISMPDRLRFCHRIFKFYFDRLYGRYRWRSSDLLFRSQPRRER